MSTKNCRKTWLGQGTVCKCQHLQKKKKQACLFFFFLFIWKITYKKKGTTARHRPWQKTRHTHPWFLFLRSLLHRADCILCRCHSCLKVYVYARGGFCHTWLNKLPWSTLTDGIDVTFARAPSLPETGQLGELPFCYAASDQSVSNTKADLQPRKVSKLNKPIYIMVLFQWQEHFDSRLLLGNRWGVTNFGHACILHGNCHFPEGLLKCAYLNSRFHLQFLLLSFSLSSFFHTFCWHLHLPVINLHCVGVCIGLFENILCAFNFSNLTNFFFSWQLKTCLSTFLFFFVAQQCVTMKLTVWRYCDACAWSVIGDVRPSISLTQAVHALWCRCRKDTIDFCKILQCRKSRAVSQKLLNTKKKVRNWDFTRTCSIMSLNSKVSK